MPTKITSKDLGNIIRDNVRAAIADRAIAGMEGAEEAARRSGKSPAELIAEEARRGAYDFPQAQGDRRRGIVSYDPHQGRGLAMARAVKAIAVAHIERKSPVDVAREFAKSNKEYEATVRALSEGSYGGAGALVPETQTTEFIELLYAATIVMALGARALDFKGTLELGKQNTSATVFYVGEAQNITPSQPSVTTLSLKGRKAAALVPLTNELLRNPSVGADTFVRDDLLKIMALRRDLSALRGAGTEFTPRGIPNWLASGNKITSAGTTLANKVADLVKMIRLVDESDVQLTKPGFAMAPRSKWDLMSTLDGNGNFTFAAMLATGTLFGFPLKTTSQIPTNLGGGGNESEVFFGTWDELIWGSETALEIETFLNATYFDGSNLVSGVSSDQSVIRALEKHDCVVRHNRSFSYMSAVTWGG